MPPTYFVSKEDACALVRLTGTVFGHHIIAALNGYLADQTWRSHFNTLWDLCEIKELILVPSDVHAFATELRRFKYAVGTGRTVIVARREIVHMSAVLYAEYASEILPHQEFRVVHSLSEALSLLRLSKASYQAMLNNL